MIKKGENYSVADNVLEAKEVAKILKVNRRTVIRLAERGELVSFRIGDLWRFNLSDVEIYIEAQKAKQQKKD